MVAVPIGCIFSLAQVARLLRFLPHPTRQMQKFRSQHDAHKECSQKPHLQRDALKECSQKPHPLTPISTVCCALSRYRLATVSYGWATDFQDRPSRPSPTFRWTSISASRGVPPMSGPDQPFFVTISYGLATDFQDRSSRPSPTLFAGPRVRPALAP